MSDRVDAYATALFEVARAEEALETVEDELFRLNRERGITLVVVTHDEDLAARCDRRVLVRDGRVVDSLQDAA